MSKTPVQLQDVDSALVRHLGSFTDLQKVVAPFTTIVNRATVTDFSKDSMPKFGINRIMTQSIQEVQGESGPNGERVWRATNDIHDQIRYVGAWSNGNDAGGSGAVGGAVGTPYIEVTFYGTGINVLNYMDASARTYTIAIDGGAATTITNSGSAILSARNYAANNINNGGGIVALGLHTAKITVTGGNNLTFFGFEILNTISTLQLSAGSSFLGGKKLSKSALTTDPYNSNFEAGTLGTKGGHVVVYQKSDGSIAKAVTPTDASSLYNTSVSHTNESIIRSYNWREFAAGRTDDFAQSTLAGGSTVAAAFTLDDGTTTLMGTSLAFQVNASLEAIFTNAVSTSLFFTFVGTGLDVLMTNDSSRTDTLTVDGVSQGSITAGAIPTLVKVCSGLPYGTHTIKLTSGGASSGCRYSRFIVYGPIKPAIPTGAVELADYYLIGNFTANATQGSEFIAQGVLRKASAREAIYSGSYAGQATIGPGTGGAVAGWSFFTTTATNFLQYTFFGTGCDLRFTATNTPGSLTVTVDGSTPTVAGATAVGFYGQCTNFVSSTGVITMGSGNNYGSGAYLTGLPLGLHTVKVVISSGILQLESIDIVTPVHSQKSDIPGDLQSTLAIGSCAIGDSRKFASQQVKALSSWAQAVGVSSGPTTTSTSNVPMPDMVNILKTSGNPVEIFFGANIANNTIGATVFFSIYVDGIQVSPDFRVDASTSNNGIMTSGSVIVPVASGVHLIQGFWRANSNSATSVGNGRVLKSREI